MSGLEKFQANDAWRANFKKALLAERKIAPQLSEPIKQSQRFSLDISEDLSIILKRKGIPKRRETKEKSEALELNQLICKNMEELADNVLQQDSNENYSENGSNKQVMSSAASGGNVVAITPKYSAVNQHEETLFDEKNEKPQWQRTSDESFEAIEKMCNKTASDPDSTLFQYIHSDYQDKVVESAKKRSQSGENEEVYNFKEAYDIEARSLKRLLDELRLEEQINLENESPLKGVDETALEDVEAPSRLWENTISNETILQTSPVKMVGLLRPSTIMEEYDGEDVSIASDVSSHLSFQSASKGAPSEVSSSCYETAADSTVTSKEANSVSNTLIAFEEEADHLKSASKSLPQIMVTEATLNNFSTEAMLGEVSVPVSDLEESADLIDLEMTFGPLHKSPHSSLLDDETVAENAKKTTEDRAEIVDDQEDTSESEDSVIEIFSDDDANGNGVGVITETPQIKRENISVVETNSPASPRLTCNENISVAEINSPASPRLSCRSPDFNQNKENCSGLEESANKSMHFNDTMEEVEYMMKKGLQYLAAASNTASNSPAPVKPMLHEQKSSPLKSKQNICSMSPKFGSRFHSPSPVSKKQKPILSSIGKTKAENMTPKSGEKIIAKPKPLNPFSLEMKPFPKFELFKKPTSGAHIRHKDSNTKQFSHIVSPIRAYITKSTNTPLMLTINDVDKNPNSLTSMRELENESRLYKPNFDGATASLPIASSGPCSLPKKAYISSEFKHVVDERTPVKIPGGKQYQKHITTAILPAVLKHEGKMNIPGFLGNCSSGETSSMPAPSSHNPRRTDESVGDLSVMTGDISMYTIKDARKF